VPKSKAVEDLFVDSSNRLVSYSYDSHRVPQLHVWQMTRERDFQLTYDERMTSFRARSRPVQMDDQYIAIIVFGQKDSDFSEIYFLSTKSMNIERSLSTRTRVHRYQSGLFFYYKDGRVS
jgi:hypothetical protein